jgi:hypothetical protein
MKKPKWKCEDCGAEYAEYVNGYPKCWQQWKVKFSVRERGK